MTCQLQPVSTAHSHMSWQHLRHRRSRMIDRRRCRPIGKMCVCVSRERLTRLVLNTCAIKAIGLVSGTGLMGSFPQLRELRLAMNIIVALSSATRSARLLRT